MSKLGLALNEAKTSVKDAGKERFDFLGYTFGPHRRTKDGRLYMGASPSKKSTARIKAKIGEMLTPANMAPWPRVRQKLNRLLLGWAAYFGYGSLAKAYRDVDHYVVDHVRGFLARRHKMQNRGARRFSRSAIHGELEVVSLWKPHPNPTPRASP
jgi:RNA-directed DNA polymerase